MLISGTVERESKKVFDNGKVLRDVQVLEKFRNGRHGLTWIQVWGENGIDTKPGAKIDCEVELQVSSFAGKDGVQRTRAKLVVVQ